MIRSYLQVARRLAREAVPIALSFVDGELDVREKVDGQRVSPVSLADEALDAFLVSGLREFDASVPILSEEGVDDASRLSSRRVWVVDPLDGTKEFVAGRDEYTINIALVEDGRPVVGVVTVPAQGVVYSAAVGVGAFLDDKPISVSSRDSLSDARLVHSRSHVSSSLKDVISRAGMSDTLAAGSSVKGCLVAYGEAELYPRLGSLMEWDVAAMQCVVEQAGGRMTRLDGSAVVYNKASPRVEGGFLVSNLSLHDEFLALLEE